MTIRFLLGALLSVGQLALQSQAEVGPLRAWMARSASGACQLRLRNAGDVPLEAWTLTVHSADARHTTIVREDHWRDAYHLPLGASRIEPGETDAFTIPEDGALGPLVIRVALIVRSDGVAFANPEAVPGVGTGHDERRNTVARRMREATEAKQLADAIDARLASDGVVPMFEARRISALLEAQGNRNWWRISDLVAAAERLPAGDRSGSARVREAVGLLRDAHRKGSAEVILQRADPMRPVAVGTCE